VVRRITLNKETVNVKNIWVNVTCPNCSKTYNVQMKGANTTKNCRCEKGTFYFSITPMKGVLDISVHYQFSNEQVVDMDANDITID
jgi:hypothetical protein